ncbi:MAG: 5'-nucleotidase SurE [Desulfovibrio sp.]
MIVALTNDDGIRAPGLRSLYTALNEAGYDVRVIAPMSEQSAVGHSITIREPLRAKEYKENGFSGFGISGTPADCIKLGTSVLLDEEPDIVLSGINAGANVGPDIMYSGTVAAAREAAAMGCSAMALSYDSFTPVDPAELARYATFAVDLMTRIPWQKIPDKRVINVNFPNVPFSECKGLKICPQTSAVWHDWYVEHKDPRGTPYWWLDGEIPPSMVAPGTDRAYLTEGWITLTPLRFDFTDTDTLAALQGVL